MKIDNIERCRLLSDHFERIQRRKQGHKTAPSHVDRVMAIKETIYLLEEDRVEKVEKLVLELLDEQERDVVKQIEEL